jgi:hypothetical protein
MKISEILALKNPRPTLPVQSDWGLRIWDEDEIANTPVPELEIHPCDYRYLNEEEFLQLFFDYCTK